MAKLTLSFKDRKLKVFGLSSEDCLIGRDSDCTIQIDSLAVEPRHARVQSVGGSFELQALDSNALVLVNGTRISEPQQLHDSDQVQIGKHLLEFSEQAQGAPQQINVTPLDNDAWLQIQNGSHLGRTIRLDKAFTRIGRTDRDLAVIARRGNGYYLSHLQGERLTRVNQADIEDRPILLKDKDIISVGELAVQFFAAQASDAATAPADPADQQQRRFTRIHFDTPVTLHSDQRSWDTELVDISLHGALIKTPASLQVDMDQRYHLSVHLDAEQVIGMEVAVAHQHDEELGLRCVDIDLDSITHLRRLVELNLGEAELVERELAALG
jgi:pSer/pThr/pTyr-binding forkhead associated (FHA) protein